jgi:threonine-phosphate decarboxylase
MVSGDRHGGDIYRAARGQGCRIEELCDFSASINPLGPPAAVSRVLRKEWRAIAHYPDPAAHDVGRSLSRRFGLPAEWFLIGNGSAELIHLLPMSLGIGEALVVGPTFAEYGAAVGRAGGRSRPCLAERTNGYRPPIEQMMNLAQTDAGRSGSFTAMFVCNPNSPTGQAIGKADLLSVVETLHRQGRWAIIDEAFCDFAPAYSLIDAVRRYPRLVIVRSATKFYAIPGLRLGYLVGHPAVLEQVRRRQPPWSVNVLAQLAAVAAFDDSYFRAATLRYVEKERPRFESVLRAIPGVRLFPSVANFLLLELPRGRTAARLAGWLRPRGILIRDCSRVPGLNPRTIRVAVKRRLDNERLCRALQEMLHD